MKTNSVENNILLAEFLGYEVVTVQEFVNELREQRNNGIYFTPKTLVDEDLTYHTDWNQLIQVVEKIESLKISVLIGKNTCVIEQTYGKTSIGLGVKKSTTKIEAVYNACVEFVKWYNEQDKQAIQDSIDLDEWSKQVK